MTMGSMNAMPIVVAALHLSMSHGLDPPYGRPAHSVSLSLSAHEE